MKAHDTIQRANELRAWLIGQGEDDPDLIRDMIEGETDLLSLCDWAVRRYLDETAFAAAIKDRKDAIGDRQKAAERRAEKMQSLIQDCMNALGEKSYRGTDATVTIREVPPKPFVTDEALLPERFIRVKREVNKAAINEAFKAGEDIPGTSIDNGGVSLTVRSK